MTFEHLPLHAHFRLVNDKTQTMFVKLGIYLAKTDELPHLMTEVFVHRKSKVERVGP